MNAIETAACDAALALVESGWGRVTFSLAIRPDAAGALVASLGRPSTAFERARFEALVNENLRWAHA